MSKVILEVCAGDLEAVKAAAEGGAARVELCSALGEGGVTPSYGFIAEARKYKQLGLNVLIRPRGGDFLYSEAEVDCMVADIKACRELGADGVVIGALRKDGTIDADACRRMVEAAGPMSVTFHRAFDVCRDPEDALEQIIALGCDRVLTSGRHASAHEGREVLGQLVRQAAGRIIILAGAGVSAKNVAEIVRASGVTEVHSSARRAQQSLMEYRQSGVSMGAPGTDEFTRMVTHPEAVAEIIAAANA